MDVLIRRATSEDAGVAQELIRQLGYDRPVDEVRGALDRLDVLVAIVDGRIAGLIQMALVESVESPMWGEIRALVVAEDLRGRGIGERLVAAGEQWTRDRGVHRVRVRSNIVRERTRRFYERLGYRVTKTQNAFDRSLG